MLSFNKSIAEAERDRALVNTLIRQTTIIAIEQRENVIVAVPDSKAIESTGYITSRPLLI
jgi:hypothetical protein